MNWWKRSSIERTNGILIMTRGPSGSGKSTMAERLASKYDAPIFSTDDFFMKNGVYQWNPEDIAEAHRWNESRTKNAMENKTPVIIVDNTNTQFWEMKPYVKMAEEYGYKTIFKEPNWSSDLRDLEGKWNKEFLNEMQKNKDRQQIEKTLPPEVIDKMVSRYEYNPTIEKVLKSERPF